MRKLFTNILRYSLVLIFQYASISASAEEYKSMIRYDRVWECLSTYWFVNSVNYMRFDGTEEINGKTYHKLITFRKAGFDFTSDPENNVFLYDELDDLKEHEGYLREENGVVYALIANNGAEDPEIWKGRNYVPTEDFLDYPYLTEEVIYNFNCEEGDSYEGITYFVGEAIKQTFTVKSIDRVDIDGEECRRFVLLNVFGVEFPVVESVGASMKGCLNYHEFLVWPIIPRGYHELNRVFDREGNVIYTTEEDWEDIPYVSSGIDAVPDATIEQGTPIYDIMGRRISSPVPGQLYIQDGKKYIGGRLEY